MNALSELPLVEALWTLITRAGPGGLRIYGLHDFIGEQRLEATPGAVMAAFGTLCNQGKVQFMRLNGGGWLYYPADPAAVR